VSSTFAFSLILLVLAIAGVCCDIPFVSNYAFWVVIFAYVILNWGGATLGVAGANWAGILSLVILILALVGVFVEIPFVSNYAFWIAIAAYIIRDWTFRTLIWTGVLSLIVLMLALVGVFVFIPVVSHYAFWVAIAAYIIRLLVGIPRVVPDRIGLVHVS
jgi:hypothetical protein